MSSIVSPKLLTLFCFCLTIGQAKAVSAIEKIPETSNNKENITAEDQTNTGTFNTPEGPPPGFEDLAKIQLNQIDVYHAGELIASTMAEYDNNSITFLNPEEITNNISGLLDNKSMPNRLKNSFKIKGMDFCESLDKPPCGVLHPEVADILFDPSTFHAKLFINPSYLEVKKISFEKYLSAPSDDFSTIHNLKVIASGNSNQSESKFASIDSLIALGKSRFRAALKYDNQRNLYTDNLLIEKDYRNWRLQLGTINGQNLSSSLIKTRDFAGVSLSSMFDMRTDLQLSTGTPIFIFLNERSRVEIYRENKIIDSRFYDSGNQQLDTSGLPNGTYMITINIHDSHGIRKEEHFFNRSKLLPPADHALHFINAGNYLDSQDDSLPEINNHGFLQLGSRYRIKDNLGAELQTLFSTEYPGAIQTGMYYFQPGLFTYGGIIGSQAGQFGFSGNINYKHSPFSLTLNHQQLDDNNENINDRLVNGEKTNIALSSKLLQGIGQLRYTRDAVLNTESLNLSYKQGIWKKNGLQVNASAQAKISENDSSVNLRINLTHQHKGNRESINYSWSDEDKNSVIEARVIQNIIKKDQLALQHSTTINTNYKDEMKAGYRIDGTSKWGKGYLEGSQTQSDNNSTSKYSVGFKSSLTSSKLRPAISNKEKTQAAIMINVDGSDDNTFDIIVNNRFVKTTSANTTQSLALKPYSSYTIALLPKAGHLSSFEKNSRKVTLLPGSVNYLQWNLVSMYVLAANAIYPDGTSVGTARITNLDEFSATDDNGWFQVELTNQTSLSLKPVDKTKQPCTIKLPENINNEEVVIKEKLICTPNHSI